MVLEEAALAGEVRGCGRQSLPSLVAIGLVEAGKALLGQDSLDQRRQIDQAEQQHGIDPAMPAPIVGFRPLLLREPREERSGVGQSGVALPSEARQHREQPPADVLRELGRLQQRDDRRRVGIHQARRHGGENRHHIVVAEDVHDDLLGQPQQIAPGRPQRAGARGSQHMHAIEQQLGLIRQQIDPRLELFDQLDDHRRQLVGMGHGIAQRDLGHGRRRLQRLSDLGEAHVLTLPARPTKIHAGHTRIDRHCGPTLAFRR